MPVLVICRRDGSRYRVHFDEQDRVLVEAFTWRVSFGSRGRTPYAATNVVFEGKRTTLKMHRLIMNDPPGLVDHRDQNGLNNRRRNLRVASAELQQLNKRPTRRNKSGVVGVHKSGKRWVAHGGDPRSLEGHFRRVCRTKAEAVSVRKTWLAKRLKELE